MKAFKVTVEWSEMDVFTNTLSDLNKEDGIFAYQIDALTGVVCLENECGEAYAKASFDYRTTPKFEFLK